MITPFMVHFKLAFSIKPSNILSFRRMRRSKYLQYGKISAKNGFFAGLDTNAP